MHSHGTPEEKWREFKFSCAFFVFRKHFLFLGKKHCKSNINTTRSEKNLDKSAHLRWLHGKNEFLFNIFLLVWILWCCFSTVCDEIDTILDFSNAMIFAIQWLLLDLLLFQMERYFHFERRKRGKSKLEKNFFA